MTSFSIIGLRFHGLQLVLEFLNVYVSFSQLIVVRLGPPLSFDIDALEQLLLLLLEQVIDLMYLPSL